MPPMPVSSVPNVAIVPSSDDKIAPCVSVDANAPVDVDASINVSASIGADVLTRVLCVCRRRYTEPKRSEYGKND